MRNHDCRIFEDGSTKPNPYVSLSWRGQAARQIMPLRDRAYVSAVLPQTQHALQPLHEAGILHTDVNADTVLFRRTDNRVTVAYFQHSEARKENGEYVAARRTYSTAPYRAPEA